MQVLIRGWSTDEFERQVKLHTDAGWRIIPGSIQGITDFRMPNPGYKTLPNGTVAYTTWFAVMEKEE